MTLLLRTPCYIKENILHQIKITKKSTSFNYWISLIIQKKKIKEGHIVFQLGKFTNYISKSMGMAFGLDFYQQLFKDVFRPHWKTKLFEIGSMNLLAYPEDDQDFDQIPGYVIFEW